MARRRVKLWVVPVVAAAVAVVLSVTVVDPASAYALAQSTSERVAAEDAADLALGLEDQSIYPLEESETPELPEPSAGGWEVAPDTSDPVPTSAPVPAVTKAPEPVEVDADDLEGRPVVDRDEYSTTYQTADGGKTTAMTSLPSNVRDEDGDWVEAETELSTTGDESWLGRGGAEVELHPLAPVFAEFADAENVLTMTRNDNTLGFTLQGAAHSVLERDLAPWAGEEQKSHLEYRGVFTDVDLVYDVDQGSVKENLRLNAVPAAGASSWTWEVDAGELTASKNEDGDVLFTDAAGEVVYTIPRPTMWDSSGTSKKADVDAQVELALQQKGGKTLVSISPSRTWLTSAARVYPVYVDPTTLANVANATSYKSTPTSNAGMIQVGNTNSTGIWRSIVHFNYEQLFGKQIIGSQARVSGIYAGGTSGTYTGGIHDVSCLGFNCAGPQLATLTISNSGGLSDSNDGMTGKIAEWVRNSSSGNNLMFGGYEGAGAFSYRQINLELYIAWKDYPAAGWNPLPANGAQRQKLAPTLHADAWYLPPEPNNWLAHRYRVSTTSNFAGERLRRRGFPRGAAEQAESQHDLLLEGHRQGRLRRCVRPVDRAGFSGVLVHDEQYRLPAAGEPDR